MQSRALPTSCKAGQSPPRWSQVFVAASEDERQWSRELRHPAVGFLARGHSRGPVQRVSEDPPQRRRSNTRSPRGSRTARPTTATTCLNQFTCSPKKGQEKFLRHHSRRHVNSISADSMIDQEWYFTSTVIAQIMCFITCIYNMPKTQNWYFINVAVTLFIFVRLGVHFCRRSFVRKGRRLQAVKKKKNKISNTR